MLIGVFKQQSNDKKFIVKVCCFLCELQLMSPITEIVAVTRLVRQLGHVKFRTRIRSRLIFAHESKIGRVLEDMELDKKSFPPQSFLFLPDYMLSGIVIVIYLLSTIIKSIIKQHAQLMSWTALLHLQLPTN